MKAEHQRGLSPIDAVPQPVAHMTVIINDVAYTMLMIAVIINVWALCAGNSMNTRCALCQ